MTDYAIRTTGLSRDYGRVRALEALTLDVPTGAILTLLGPNGAGKTTLLKLLAGLLEPTAGQATVLGSPARRMPPEACGRVAYVGEQNEPPGWATLGLLADLQAGAAPRLDRHAFAELCARRGLAAGQRYGSLSKGQRKGVLTSLALASGAALVLLDEPADGLDPAARRALYDALRDHVTRTEATAVVTTHVIADVERVADEVAILDAGRLLLCASLEDLRESVRQVELEGGRAMPDLDGAATILGGMSAAGAAIAWVRCGPDGDAELRRRLGPAAVVRTVGLEALYLAVAEHRMNAQAAEREKP
ncbi:MAG: ABC transporter ATP-binding protein [Planctomycetota bacterium]|nr:ABC transporter ATP-binding protein [Planctomycetota bacterium]